MQLEITEQALDRIRRKGGVAALDFIPPLG